MEKQEHTVPSDGESNDLYEWSAGRQCLLLVNVRSESEGGGLVSECGAALGQGSTLAGSSHGAVSGDGSEIFFTAPDPTAEGPDCWRVSGTVDDNTFAPQVYMRFEERAVGEPEGALSTVEVSAPGQGVRPSATYPAVFAGASEDGSRVFFVTRTELTRRAVEMGTQGLELYEYDVNGSEEAANWWERRLVLVSAGEMEGVNGGAANVLAISADGSTVYFNGTGELTPGSDEGLYRFDTATGKTTRVGQGDAYPEGSVGLNVSANYYTTRDGRFLLFASAGDVTGYASHGVSELYRYDADSPMSQGVPGVQDNPVCVSCNPNGAPPLAGSEFTRSSFVDGNPSGTAPRPISEEGGEGPQMGRNDGSYVFFDTAESLVPQATNGKVDVYEWETDGMGSCREVSGCVSLVGSGQDPLSSFFLDSSENGSNVFFGTHARLVPQDTDTEGDLYDARICEPENGNPCIQPPSAESKQCEGDACDNPPPAPIEQTPAMLTFSGPGNPPATPEPKPEVKKTCPKGKKLSHGKCARNESRRTVSKSKKPSRPTRKVNSSRRAGK